MADIQSTLIDKFTITRKLLAVVVVNLLLMSLIGTYAVKLMLTMGDGIEDTVLIDIPRMNSLTLIESHILEQQEQVEKLLGLAEEAQTALSAVTTKSMNMLSKDFNRSKIRFKALSKKILAELDKNIIALTNVIDSASVKNEHDDKKVILDRLKAVKREQIEYESNVMAIIDSIEGEEWTSSTHLAFIIAVENEGFEVNQTFIALRNHLGEWIQADLLTTRDNGHDGVKAIVFLVIIALLFSLTISLLTIRRILKPINKIVENVKEVSGQAGSMSFGFNSSQNIVSTAVDAVISIEQDGTIIWVNPATEKMFKHSADFLVGKNIKVLMPEPYHSEHDNYLSKYKTTGIKSVIGQGREVQALRSDGSTFHIFLSVSEMKQGNEIRYTGFIRDISKQKQFEAQMLRSEALNRGMVDTCLDAIISISTKGVILSSNIAAQSLFQYTNEELLGKKINTLMPSPFRDEHDGYLSNYLTTGTKKVIGQGREAIGLKKDGSTFPMHLTAGEIIQENGDKFFTGFVRDISLQKQIEQEMRKSEALNRGMVDTCLDAIISISTEGTILSCNIAAQTLFQYSSEELVGKKINSLMPSPFREEHDGYLNNYRISGIKKVIGQGREAIGLKKDGSTFPMYLTAGEIILDNGDKFFTGFVRDITLQKKIEQEMKKSEALNRGMVNTCLDAILSISAKGVILSCNRAGELLFQYTNEELVGKKINSLMPSPFRDEHDGYLSNYLTTGIKKVIGQGREAIGLKKDGSTFPMYLTAGEVEQDGEIIFTGFVRDISKDKEYELELQRNNEVLRKQNELKEQVSCINDLTQGASELAAMSDDIISALAGMMKAGHGVIYTYDDTEDGLTLSGSYAFKKRKAILPFITMGEGLVGQCAKELKTILLTQVPSDYIQINSALGQSTPLNVLVVPVLFEDKLVGVIELASFRNFKDEQVEVIELICCNLGIVINNLSNQQRTQALLLETQKQSEELQSQQEELRSSNESLLEQTQRLKASEEELKEQSEELQVSNEELEEKQVFLKRQKDEIEAAKTDLTVKAEELALASKYKSEFLANMSHELRTPLNSLLLLAKGLADNKSQHLDDVEVEDAKIIFDGGNNLLCLINDIMDLSKVEAGKLSIHIEAVNISGLCRNLKQVFNPIAKSRELTFNIEIDKRLPATVTSDGQRIEQILRNLLSNALKFTETGCVTLAIGYAAADVRFSHSSLDAKSALSFAVIDTGIGIPANKIQAIFEAFQQQDGSTSRKYGGTGLGLTIARELTRLLGGEIQLKSVPNQGSTFTLFLPNEYDSNGVEAKEGGSAIVSDIKFSTFSPGMESSLDIPRSQSSIMQPYPEYIPDDRAHLVKEDPILLVIDDDPNFAKVLRDHAREQGYQCLVAGDGRMGIFLAQEYQPNGIILDIMLPDIDGHQVLEQLKYNLKTRHIPVEIISAHSEDKNAALAQGAIGLQTKPVTQETLIKVFDDLKAFSSSELRRVLVIEDDVGNQTSIVRLLESCDIDIKCVATGTDGIKEVLSGQYDCVILDLGLPDISGFEVLKCIESSELALVPPVIIYTGKELTDAEQGALNQFSSTIVVKGVGSGERLLDDVSLFLHDIESRFCSDSQKVINMLHDEDAMLKGRRVLLVDDDMRNTYALSKKLIEVGFDLDMAHNGKEAVEQLEQDKSFDLILMDTMMPEMDGYEATRLIRAMTHYKQIPIIALTAKTMPEDRERSFQAGASEYLTKPIDFEKLLSIMRIWLFKH